MLTRARTIIGISIAVAGTVLAIFVLVLWQMRSDAADRAEEGALNLALLVERDVARNLDIYDLSLQAAIDGMKVRDVKDLRPEVRQLVLFDRAASAEDVGAILVIDAAGNVLYDSRTLTPPRVNVADRDYFTVQRDSPNVGLFVSRPFKPRTSGAGISIALSRRLSNPDGSFAGIVVGTLRVDYFRKLFAGMNLGPHGSMALFFTDGTMLMRRPYDDHIVGSPLANYQRFTLSEGGIFSGHSAIDGVTRWYVYHRIGRFPIVLDVALSTEDMYTVWRDRAWTLGSLVVALDALIIGLAVLLSAQLRRRLAVESELRELARTDGLTRLGNRRAFDELAAEEWRAAAGAQHAPLSLLLIDVDHFKGFNDLYGHASGDDALLAVAGCIKEAARRPGDHAVRYGGEEFIVLLPDTEAAGALCVAERIRASVEALGMRHESSEHGVLTVSIGIASTALRTFTHLRALTDGADAALYAAKADGRNCIVCDGPEDVVAPEVSTLAAPADLDPAL